MTQTLPQRLRILPKRRDLPTSAAGRDLLIREPETGQVHFLNASGAVIWTCCDGDTLIEACDARLRSAFAIPADVDLTQDILDAVSDLARRGLLESSQEVVSS